mgnify:FL=1
MEIKSVFSDEFKKYGVILQKYDFSEILTVMSSLEIPESGFAYQASVSKLENCKVFAEMQNRGFGGIPVQLGYCAGRNADLNCLEYHKSSEFNITLNDIILMLGCRYDIKDGRYDTSKVEAFLVPAGTGVELYETTLHYAPCGCNGKTFQVACVLPRGTNEVAAEVECKTAEDQMYAGKNKWLLAHADSDEAKKGLYVGLKGENLQYK